jgi:hypothetical protein
MYNIKNRRVARGAVVVEKDTRVAKYHKDFEFYAGVYFEAAG